MENPKPTRATLRRPAGHLNWQRDANCRNVDPAVFFASEDENRTARRDREQAAKRLCLHCPVQTACRRHAVSTREAYGVWGGTSETERRYLQPESPAAPSERTPLRILPRHHPPGHRVFT